MSLASSWIAIWCGKACVACDHLIDLATSIVPDPGSDIARVSLLESSNYMRHQLLRDADWAGMAHGVEIRVPLVDVPLLKSVAAFFGSLVPGAGKVALAQTPSRPLPDAVVTRAKTGFAVPTGAWMSKSRRLPRCGRRTKAEGTRFPRLVASGLLRLDVTEGCARVVKSEFKMIALVPDAYGGHGGIAQYNRDFFGALVGCEEVSSISVIPRNAPNEVATPTRIRQTAPRPDRALYVVATVLQALSFRIDVVFCGHLFMAPLALFIARLKRAKLIIQMHGIEAWQRPTPLCRSGRRRR